MQVGVDGWRIHGTTGVPRYLGRIVAAWATGSWATSFDGAVVYTPRPIDRTRVPIAGPVREEVVRTNARQLVWQNGPLRRACTADVLWCPSYTRPLGLRVPTVVTTHDVTYRIHPTLYPRATRYFYSYLYGWCARTATLVVTHNEATAADVRQYLGVRPERVRVVPLAPAPMFRRLTDREAVARGRQRLLGDDRPYFLSVGKVSVRRNLPLIIEAFQKLKARTGLPHRLVVAGRNQLGRAIPDIARELGIAEHVVHLDFVTDDDLVLLYNGADAFVTAATYEGNSLTSLEAQATGAPVVIPDVRGMREMTGEHAVVLPRVTSEHIAEAMERLAVDRGLRKRLSEAGEAFATGFSWDRAARATLAVLEEAVGMSEGARQGPSVAPVPRTAGHPASTRSQQRHGH